MTAHTPRGYTVNMPDKLMHNRLSRIEGQLKKLQTEIDSDTDCSLIIPQFLAVKGALASAFEEYVKQSLEHCQDSDEMKMKQLIALLVRS